MVKRNYANDPYEAKHQFLINKRESTELKHFHDSKAFIEYSNKINNLYTNIEEFNPNKKRTILITFHDKIVDMLSIEKLNSIVTELVIRGKKLIICLVVITQTYFKVPKNVRLNTTHCFIMEVPNKQIAYNQSTDIDFKDFMNLYQTCPAKPYSFLVTDDTVASDNLLRFRKNLLEGI